MDFEEMQVIWDSQKGRRLYALDLDALHASVRRKGRGIERGVNTMEAGMVLATLFLAAFLAYEPIFEGTDLHQLFGAGLMLGCSIHLALGRIRRRRRESGFEPSLRGDLDRALSQVDYHLVRARTFQWWFLLPALVITGITYAFKHETKEVWYWPMVLGGVAVSYLLVRMEIRCIHLPRKHDLEALRAKLVEAD